MARLFKTGITAEGTVSATTFSGSGASLTSLNGSNISSGTVADARIASTIARTSSVNLKLDKTIQDPTYYDNGIISNLFSVQIYEDPYTEKLSIDNLGRLNLTNSQLSLVSTPLVLSFSPIRLGSSDGNVGQVLTSAGAGNVPTWGLTQTALSTGFSIAGGTTSKTLTVNRTLTLTGTDSTTMTFPSTSATIARTDAAQTFTGTQTFSSSIDTPGIARSGTSGLSLTTATGTTGTAGNITITAGGMDTSGTGGNVNITGGTVLSGNGGNINLNAGGGGTSGTINIGTTTASSISIGRTGLTTTTAGSFTATQTITGGNLTSGGTLVRSQLNADGQGTTGCNINTSGQFVRAASSARYKQDIEDANFVYEDILLLSPKTFRLKEEVLDNPDSRFYGGLIAEEVAQIESLKVFVNYQKQEDGSKIPDGIAYGEMVSALISALKHQDAKIKALETRIEQLEN